MGVMGRKKGFTKKDKFDSLDSDFKEAVAQSSTDEIRRRVSEIAILEVTEKQILKQDPAVLEAKEKLKNVMEPYRESLKAYRLKIEWCKRVLDDKGGGAPISKPQ